MHFFVSIMVQNLLKYRYGFRVPIKESCQFMLKALIFSNILTKKSSGLGDTN